MVNSKNAFLDAFNKHIKRDGSKDLLNWLETCGDFFTAPASTQYHENFEGGLVLHSLNVFYHLNRLNDLYNLEYSKETLAIVSLLHDVCKINCYKPILKWKKDEYNNWVQYQSFIFEEDFKFGGHGSKSVYLIQNYMKLLPEEATAINCHMGVESMHNIGSIYNAFRSTPLAFILHTADVASTIDCLNNSEGNVNIKKEK